MMQSADRYAVMGNPIAHSKSPRIHALFAEQTGEPVTYEALLVPVDGFHEAVARFHEEGGKGLNITVPFKEQAFQLADSRSPRAEQAKAVNTLVLQANGTRFGDNTDGIGLVRDLTERYGLDLQAARILLIGAGGAARGVVGPLLEAGPSKLYLANRTAAKAADLAIAFAHRGPITGGGFDGIAKGPYEVIINATAASLEGEVPPLPEGLVGADTVVYDMMYAETATAFVQWGRAQGAALAVDGLGMLVEQAAESFYIWRGVRPATDPVVDALRAG